MSSIPVQEVFNRLRAAGHGVTLTPQGGLRVTYASRLTNQLRHLIEMSKVELANWLDTSAANDALEPLDWKQKHNHYMNHHFQCGRCISGSRGVLGVCRCDVGSSLWAAYITATNDATINLPLAKSHGSYGGAHSNALDVNTPTFGTENQMTRTPIRVVQRNSQTPFIGTRE
jgi:hypothetical protein